LTQPSIVGILELRNGVSWTMSSDESSANTPELLAPAGGIESGLAAFDAGADAVYAGLQDFNARARAQNLTQDELSKLIAYARGRGRRVYVTLNTLLKDAELGRAAEILAELVVIRPDAVIVQDIGLVHMIREYFAELPIHASTQMGIHNSAGVSVAARMGISRVILERQTTFEEIRTICRCSPVDIEVFVHGALCCSRSGTCLLSSWMGGWSGNRGRCKQPCRRRYHAAGGNGFYFSTQDLYSLDAIPELARMGVCSLKIEGRLRNPDYVTRVVSAYRTMLDAPPESPLSPLKEAKAVLSGTMGRRWTAAMRTEHEVKQVIQHDALGASGLLCGKVTRASETGFTMQVSRPVSVGDVLRVQPSSGDEGPVFTVTRLSVDRHDTHRARRGQACWVYCDKPVAPRSPVFKTGEKPPDMGRRVAKLPAARAALDIEVKLEARSLHVAAPALRLDWQCPVSLVPARTRALTTEDVRGQFRKTRSSTFSAGRVDVALPDGVFMPAGDLKQARRAFWTWLDATADASAVGDNAGKRVAAVLTALDAVGGTGRAPERVVRMTGTRSSRLHGAIVARGLDATGNPVDEAVLPEFCCEGNLSRTRECVAALLEGGTRRFRVTSLYGFDMLHDVENIDITASFPIPVCNAFAAVELQRLGAAKMTAWVELEKAALEQLVAVFRGDIEIFTLGRLPLLCTRFTVPVSGRIKDGRGTGFRVVRQGDETLVFADKGFSGPAIEGASTYYDLTHADLDEKNTDAFNFFRELV